MLSMRTWVKMDEAGGADGLADADLADALVDAGEHDVHDADAAHQQADGRDDAAAHAGVANLLVDGLQLVLLGAEAEILDAAMGEHEDVARLLQRGFELLEAGHFEVDVGEPVVRDAAGVAGGAEAQPGGVERHVDRLVLAVERPVAAASPAARARGTGLLFLALVSWPLPAPSSPARFRSARTCRRW